MIDLGRAYLESIRRTDKRISCLEAEYTKLKSMMYSIKTVSYDHEPIAGGRRKDIGDLVAELDEKGIALNAEIDRWVALRAEARLKINNMPYDAERAILLLRYVVNLKWGQIMDVLDISRATCHRLHQNALHNFGKFNTFFKDET